MASFASISGKYARILPSKLKFTATTKTIAGAISGTTIAAGAYYHTQSGGQFSGTGNNGKRNFSKSAAVAGATGANIKIAKVPEGKSFEDYQEVYNAIATKIAEHLSFDHNDGYYAGGSFGGTMIFPPEEMDYENNGLSRARSFLAEFQVRYPWISRGDLWTLGGVCGVQESSGPKIEWRPGRVDDNSGYSPENGRIPSGTIDDGAEIKRFFSRMGLDAKDTVALIGARMY
ncbi:hypothetical protein KGF54_002844 [Candida jiufengensis]|uniref:uncharacterized protein n=1 Tax=Candida jiufengensis TaxID=497108 RepID=UPI0022244097|nr:uncharacterized protein KGF54_002844 [Candida jiufengensis]KAI5953472.1 hypothetical protein KGF54_002844 [Candida jiufengensis]